MIQDEDFWAMIRRGDQWLDSNVPSAYEGLPQDWARVAKIAEEAGEAINELILLTGQNPRKGADPEAGKRLLSELADCALTAIFAIQHFTKDDDRTRVIVYNRLTQLLDRVGIL